MLNFILPSSRLNSVTCIFPRPASVNLCTAVFIICSLLFFVIVCVSSMKRLPAALLAS